jgi:hypothetical protein
MSKAQAEALLARLSEDARAMPRPQLNAAAIDAAVLRRVARTPVESMVALRRRSSFFWPAAGVAAAAAIVVIAAEWHGPGNDSTPLPARGQLAKEPGVDGSLLGVGRVLEARDHNLTVTHAGIATWRLRAHGRARIVEVGDRITVALDLGRIDAEVVPKQRPEVFAIEVERVRVAVRGTVFSVDRRGNVAEVAVSEGTVQLGSIEQRGATDGRLLTAPARLSVDVRPIEPDAQSAAAIPVLPSALARGAPKAVHPAAETTAAPRQPLPDRPLPEEVERIWEAATRVISECFAAQTSGSPNLRVSFGTQISVRLAPDGSVTIAGFNPPVPGPVSDCVDQRVAQLRSSPTDLGAVVSRPRVLTR